MKNGVKHPAAYASRALTKAERNYCVVRKELLAGVEFVKHFNHYLQGPRLRIKTDHAPPRSVPKVKESKGQLVRWIEFMSSFSYEIKYGVCQRHENADALSRRPCNYGCKWCKEWKKVEQMVSVTVQTDVSPPMCGDYVVEQRGIRLDNQQ